MKSKVSNIYPLVSVMLPVYNQKDYIEEAIDSILIQEYPKIQIVVGDDGSSDGTVEILKEYERKYPEKIVLIKNETNLGITRNCNKILSHCKGEFIALFAGDDVWLPGKLKKQIELFQAKPEMVLCYTMGEVFDSETNEVLLIAPRNKNNEAIIKSNPIDAAFSLGEVGCSFLIKKEAIPDHLFLEKIPFTSDMIFWVEVMTKGTIGYLEEVFVRYRRHPNNYSRNLDLVLMEHYFSLELIGKMYPGLKPASVKKKNELLGNLLSKGNTELKRNLLRKYSHKDLVEKLSDKHLMKELIIRLLQKVKLKKKK